MRLRVSAHKLAFILMLCLAGQIGQALHTSAHSAVASEDACLLCLHSAGSAAVIDTCAIPEFPHCLDLEFHYNPPILSPSPGNLTAYSRAPPLLS